MGNIMVDYYDPDYHFRTGICRCRKCNDRVLAKRLHYEYRYLALEFYGPNMETTYSAITDLHNGDTEVIQAINEWIMNSNEAEARVYKNRSEAISSFGLGRLTRLIYWDKVRERNHFNHAYRRFDEILKKEARSHEKAAERLSETLRENDAVISRAKRFGTLLADIENILIGKQIDSSVSDLHPSWIKIDTVSKSIIPNKKYLDTLRRESQVEYGWKPELLFKDPYSTDRSSSIREFNSESRRLRNKIVSEIGKLYSSNSQEGSMKSISEKTVELWMKTESMRVQLNFSNEYLKLGKQRRDWQYNNFIRTVKESDALAEVKPFCQLLYRAYGKNGELLYIGRTSSPAHRLIQHYYKSSWPRFLSHVTFMSYSMQNIGRAESYAIESESPLFNIQENSKRVSNTREGVKNKLAPGGDTVE